jgi:hypothetical protein
VKHSLTLYRLLAISGIVLLTLVLAGAYLDGADALSILTLLSPRSPNLGLWFGLGGIVLLTVGMVGIIRRYCRYHRNLFTALAILLIPPLAFATFFVGCTFAFLSAPMFPMRSEITQVTVVDNSPLVLSLDVKAITSRDSIIDGASVMNSNDVIVAEIFERARALLPAGSEITLTLDFNTTLPSGNYVIRLHGGMQYSHGSALFTVP